MNYIIQRKKEFRNPRWATIFSCDQSTAEQIPRIFLFVGVVAETGFWARSTTAYKNESHNLIVTETVKLFFVFLEATTSVGVSDFKCTGFGWSILEDVSVLGAGSLIWGKWEIIWLMAGHIHHRKHSLTRFWFYFSSMKRWQLLSTNKSGTLPFTSSSLALFWTLVFPLQHLWKADPVLFNWWTWYKLSKGEVQYFWLAREWIKDNTGV